MFLLLTVTPINPVVADVGTITRRVSPVEKKALVAAVLKVTLLWEGVLLKFRPTIVTSAPVVSICCVKESIAGCPRSASAFLVQLAMNRDNSRRRNIFILKDSTFFQFPQAAPFPAQLK